MAAARRSAGGPAAHDPAREGRAAAAARRPRARCPGSGFRSAPAEAFGLPSAFEGYATVVAEALWFGLPVVATAVGGIPYLVTSGVEGVLVPPGRPAPPAEALGRLRN